MLFFFALRQLYERRSAFDITGMGRSRTMDDKKGILTLYITTWLS